MRISLIDALPIVLACLVLSVTVPLCAQEGRNATDDAEKVDAYLKGLGLTDLRILHLERVLAHPRGGRTESVAVRLADLYATELLGTTDPEKTASLNGRIDALLKDHPAARRPGLLVLRLEGDFNRAEALAAKWIADPDEAAARDEAREVLGRIVPQLDRLQEALFRELKERPEVLEIGPGDRPSARRERDLTQIADLAGRAAYFAGWANYYAGLIADRGTKGNALFVKARTDFRKILGVDKAAKSIPETFPALDTRAMARAALGLALAEFACKDEPAARAWFGRLAAPETNAEVRDWSDFWLAWALLDAGQVAPFEEHAKRTVGGYSDAATPGRIGLCALMVRAGFGGPVTGEKGKALGMLGLHGLIRMKRLDLARALMDRYHVDQGAKPEFALRWLTGKSLFEKAEADPGKPPDGFRAAATALTSALDAPDAAGDPRLAAECRYTLAWCRYRLDDDASAADEFRRAATALKGLKSPIAADAAWMAAVALQRLAARDPTRTAPAIEAFQTFARDYPDHPNARQAGYQVLRLKQEALPLDQISPTDPIYPQACLDAARKAYRDWNAARSDRTRAGAAGAALDRYLKLPAAATTPEGKLETLQMQADLALHAAPPDLDAARARLAEAEPLAASLDAHDRLAAGLHALRLELARLGQDAKAVREQALWLIEHQPGTSFAQAGLIALARLADTAVEQSQADDAGRERLRSEALDAYRRLARALGDDPETLKNNRNALVASTRLASYAQEIGRFDEASRTWEKVLAAFPRDAGYLRKAGLAHASAGKLDEALECWRILVSGLPRGSPEWFEAKYHQLDSLARVDRTGARAALGQLKLLYPDLGPAPWPDAFRKLEARLSD